MGSGILDASHFSVFRNLAISVALRARVYKNVSTSGDVISASEGRLAPIARDSRDHRRRRRRDRRRRRRPRNDNQSRSDFRINLIIRAHASRLRSREPRAMYTSAHRRIDKSDRGTNEVHGIRYIGCR